MMKLRKIFCVLTVLFLVSILNLTTSFAQTNYIYWTDLGSSKIQRANLDGTNVQTLVTGLVRPVDIELDLTANKMYWTDRVSQSPNPRNKILRANLDGSNIETLVTGEALTTEQIELDLTGGKMYWTDIGYGPANRIQRANLDGSNIETLVTGVTQLRGIALDLTDGKMYWTDFGTGVGEPPGKLGKIQRANLDGSNIETLVTGLYLPHYLALDFNSRKLYWTEWTDEKNSNSKIWRANFNGLNIENLVTGLKGPVGITLDSFNGKIYWADMRTGKIQRANLDGTNVENIVIGLVKPVGITLATPQLSVSFAMPSEVSVGEELTATLNMANAVDLAGVQFDLHFNPVVLEIKDIQEGNLFTGEGIFFQVQHLKSVPGEISGIRIARAGGVDGSGVLLKVVFKAKAAGVSPLEIHGLELGTSEGHIVPYKATEGEVAVLPKPDVTGDGKVNILDLVRVSRYFGPASDAPPELDINGDGRISILDLILVAQHLGN